MEEILIEMQEKNTKLEKELREAKELKKKNEDSLKKQLSEAKVLQKKNEDVLMKQLSEAKEFQLILLPLDSVSLLLDSVLL